MILFYGIVFSVLFLIGIGCELLLRKKGTIAFMIGAASALIVGAVIVGSGLGDTYPMGMKVTSGAVTAIGTGVSLFLPIYASARVRDLNIRFLGSALGAFIGAFAMPYLIFVTTFRGV